MFRRMQTLVRLQSQARARASRSSHSSASFHSSTALLFPSSSSSPRSLHTRCVSNAEVISMDHRGGSKRLDWQAEGGEDEDKILEVDTWKPHFHPKPLRSDRNNESPRKRQQSLLAPRSTENSPQVGSSGSRRRTPFTPTSRSEYSWGCNCWVLRDKAHKKGEDNHLVIESLCTHTKRLVLNIRRDHQLVMESPHISNNI